MTVKTTDVKHERNARSYDEFLTRLLGEKEQRIAGPGGSWITQPVLVQGDGTWTASVPVSFAKLRVDLRSA